MRKTINFKKTITFGVMAIVTASSIVQVANANDNNTSLSSVTVGSNDSNANVFDWTEAQSADSDGWVKSGEVGDRDDLQRAYYHQPSGKYIKVSVKQRWNWGEGGETDENAYSPKIVTGAEKGMGGFDDEDMFLFSMRPFEDQVNRLTIEFYDDAGLTQKADVSNLNFTLTDLDAAPSGNGRENIIVSAENSLGSQIPVDFYRPEGSMIEDAWINGGSALGYTSNVDQDAGNEDDGNIASILPGDTHKVEITYQLAPNAAEGKYVRHMYVSDLAWNGETVKVTPDEDVKLPTPDPTPDPTPEPTTFPD